MRSLRKVAIGDRRYGIVGVKMNLILLIKDIRLILKDLKFQVFFLVLVVLFIISAISSAVTYKTLNEEFQTDLYRHQQRASDGISTQMIKMLESNPLHVINKPSPAILFSSYPNYPDKINNGIIFYTPTFDYYGSETEELFQLNWYFIISILASFIMLILSFESISHEKRAGTLRLLSIYGIKRQVIFWHKYFCYMFLYLIIIIPPAMVSLILFFALSGTWSALFMLKLFLLLLISIPFTSFFVILGIFISMFKNYRNAIVVVVFIWLFFVVIVPQSANIIAEQVLPQKTSIEYEDMRVTAYNDEYQIWNDEHEIYILDQHRLREGTRVRAINACEEKESLINQLEIDENKRQLLLIQNISSISPFTQYEKISEIILDKGFYLLKFQQETAKSSIIQIANLMKEQDSRDELSLHHFYSKAEREKMVLRNSEETPFSNSIFEQPNLLFVTEIETETLAGKFKKVFINLLPILFLNIVLILVSVVRFERLDIR